MEHAAAVDPRSGFCASTKIFHSVRPNLSLPPEEQPLSVTSYALSLLSSLSLPASHPLLIDVSTGSTVSLGVFLSQLRSLSAALRSAPFSISNGQVAFVLSPNRLEIPVLYFALLSLGAVICPSNPASTPREIDRQLRLASPSVAFATSATAALLPADIPTVLLDSPDFLRLLQSPPLDGDVPLPVGQGDTAVILFSSGTTGPPKAAAASHRSYIAMIASFALAEKERRRSMRGDAGREIRIEVMLLTAPMFHSMGCFAAMKAVALGETTLLMDRPRLPAMAVAAGRYCATIVTAAPPVVVAMPRLEAPVAEGLRSVRRILCGGAPLQVAAAERFRRRFPWIDIEQGYGSTEGGGIAKLITTEECKNFRSAGKLNAGVMVKIVDPISGECLPVGGSGELWLGGPTIMKGYLGDEEANAMIFSSDGWIKAGDLAYVDHEGYLYIVDRIKELIKYKGYQVAPAELEQLLHSFPEIEDVAVIPYPDEEAGEVPMAFIVKRPGSNITQSQVMDIVAKQVAPYKKIRRVSFIDGIPRTPAGKILRKDLIARAVSSSASRL